MSKEFKPTGFYSSHKISIVCKSLAQHLKSANLYPKYVKYSIF